MKTILFILICLFACSNPVKPKPKGECVLVLTHIVVGYPMVIDTIITCDECYKIASYGGYQVSSWTPLQ
jgi:hypothetical protein